MVVYYFAISRHIALGGLMSCFQRLGAVIAHVIDNALDAVDDDGRIEVGRGMSGREAVIEVEDNGCGMSAEFLRDELFKPFRSSKSEGYGIPGFRKPGIRAR